MIDSFPVTQASALTLYTPRSKFEFSFVAPSHFPQKLWEEADKISSIFILCDMSVILTTTLFYKALILQFLGSYYNSKNGVKILGTG